MSELPNDPVETPPTDPTDPVPPPPDTEAPDDGDGAEIGQVEEGSTFEPEEDPEGHDD